MEKVLKLEDEGFGTKSALTLSVNKYGPPNRGRVGERAEEEEEEERRCTITDRYTPALIALRLSAMK